MEQLGARIDGLGSFEGAITGLRESIEGLEAVRVGDALATGARLAALETAVESLGALEDRVREGVARDLDDRAGAFAARLAGAESRLDTFAALEERIAGLAADLERRPDTDTLEDVVAAIRAEVDELAARPTVADPSERLQELSGRIDSLEQDGHDRARGLSDELSRRIGGTRCRSGPTDPGSRRADGRILSRATRPPSRPPSCTTGSPPCAWRPRTGMPRWMPPSPRRIMPASQRTRSSVRRSRPCARTSTIEPASRMCDSPRRSPASARSSRSRRNALDSRLRDAADGVRG